MKKCDRQREKGASFIEFTLTGIPMVLLIISIFEICLAMWCYVALGYAVREGARYAVTKGQGCTFSTNTCAVTVSAVAQRIASAATGLDPGTLNVTLSASNGSSIACVPLNSCYSNSSTWPPTAADSESTTLSAASTLTVTGTYPFTLIFMPLSAVLKTSSGRLQASSQQFILF